MPGRDGTGPSGAGPMTGWGNGNCVFPITEENKTEIDKISRRSFLRQGPRQRRGRHCGRRMGRCCGQRSYLQNSKEKS